jgi:hypothetical protein
MNKNYHTVKTEQQLAFHQMCLVALKTFR